MKAGTYYHTKETLEKIRESNRRRIITESTRLKMSQSGKGKHSLWGKNNPQWKGGRKVRGDGYIMIRLYPSHPFYELVNKSGYAMEHRVIMADYLGRVLEAAPVEVIHHINGDRGDNAIGNLGLMSQSEHLHSYHHEEQEDARQT